MGQGQEHTAARILSAQLQASILRTSQSCSWLWSKWFRLYLCFGRRLAAALAKNTLLCCGLDCIYITRACENQEEAVDVRVLNRPQAAALWLDMQALVPHTSQQWKGFLSKVGAVLPMAQGRGASYNLRRLLKMKLEYKPLGEGNSVMLWDTFLAGAVLLSLSSLPGAASSHSCTPEAAPAHPTSPQL